MPHGQYSRQVRVVTKDDMNRDLVADLGNLIDGGDHWHYFVEVARFDPGITLEFYFFCIWSHRTKSLVLYNEW